MNGTIVAIHDLAPADRERMFRLLDAHFEGVTREQFECDLNEKTVAILLRDDDGVIRGFTSILAYRSLLSADSLGVICSGDTIVEPEFWGSAALARTWIAAVRSTRDALECEQTVWLLIVSGFRTYRFLPVFWRNFVPRHDHEDQEQDRLLRALAEERYGAAFDPATGIVRLPRPQRLRSHLSGIIPARHADPDVEFFLQRNPGHIAGDELACLCDLSDANLTRAGQRMVFGTKAGSAR